MSGTPPNISLFGAIPFEVGDKEIVSLTGSASVVEAFGTKGLIDLGSFQGTEGSDIFNKENISFFNDIDRVFVTHSHLDHFGRLAMLYKKGFRKSLYMTDITKDAGKIVLEDGLKINESERDEMMQRNANLGERLKKALKLRQSFSELSGTEIHKDLKKGYKGFINSELGNNYDNNKVIEQLDLYLNFYGIKEESDIGEMLLRMYELPYSQEDINGVMSLVKTVNYGEETIISNKKRDLNNGNLDCNDLLEDLPSRIGEISDLDMEKLEKLVITRGQRKDLSRLWRKKLEEEERKIIETPNDILEAKKLEKRLEIAFTYVQNQWPSYENGLNDERGQFRIYKKLYNKYSKLLRQYKIKSREDIYKVVRKYGRELPFSEIDIKKAEDLLNTSSKGSKEGRSLITAIFTDAAHLPGSASIQLNYYNHNGRRPKLEDKEIGGKVRRLLDITGEAESLCFSGDLGRMEGNRLNRPELPIKPFDYLQLETTYGGRDHLDIKTATDNLLDEIESAPGNTLISAFAQQRTQDILLRILEGFVKRGSNLPWDSLPILIDGKMSSEISNLYIKKGGDIYNLMKKEEQNEVFGKEVFRFLGENEFENIYKGEEAEKKHIIIASSGMIDGGAIMCHLPYILGDNNATILSPGYLCKGTLGHNIVMEKEKHISLLGEKKEIKCNSKFIDGFSAHIGHTELIQYVYEMIQGGLIKNGATIALTHGEREGQLSLKKDLEEILKYFNRDDVKITTPDLFYSYELQTKKFISIEDNNKKSVITKASKIIERPETPEFLRKKGEQKKSMTKREKQLEGSIGAIRTDINALISESEMWIKSILGEEKSYLIKLLKQSLKGCKLIGKLGEYYYGPKKSLSERQKTEYTSKINERIRNNIVFRKQKRNLNKKISDIGILESKIKEFWGQDLDSFNKFQNDSLILKKQLLDEELTLENRKELLIENQEDNSVELKSIETRKKNIKRDLKYIDNTNQKLKSERNNQYIKIRNFITKLFGTNKEYLEKILSITYDLYYGKCDDEKNTYNDLNELFENTKLILLKEIESLEIESEKDLVLHFKQHKLNFGTRDSIHDKIFPDGKKIDQESLDKYINDGIFEGEDLEFIKSKRNEGTKGQIAIKKFLIKKEEENLYLGIDFDLSLNYLKNILLGIFKELFEYEYYNKVILKTFNIFEYMQFNGSLRDFIEKNFTLNKLKLAEGLYGTLEEKKDDLDREMEEIKSIGRKGNIEQKTEELELLSLGAKETIKSIRDKCLELVELINGE